MKIFTSDIFKESPTTKRKSNTLVVIVHGLRSSPAWFSAFSQDCIKAENDVYIPKMPYGKVVSSTPTSKIVSDLNANITQYVSNKNYDKIILIGHSFGAQIIRSLYCAAWVAKPGSSDEYVIRKESPWVEKVERIVYIAGMHRGWDTESFVKRSEQAAVIFFNLVTVFYRWLPRLRPTFLESRRGSPSLIALRMKAQRLNKYLSDKRPDINPVTVQVLGARDDFVTPVSQIDISPNSQTYYAEVSGSGHKNIIYTPSYYNEDKTPETTQEQAETRQHVFGTVIYAPEKVLKAGKDDNIFSTAEYEVQNVTDGVTDLVFIIHGIRDKAYWTPKLARKIKAKAEEQKGKRKVETATPTYGYFPIVNFLAPILRRKKVDWLIDQYVMLRAKYPDAKFHYIGHSNGTQLFVEALRKYKDFHFENVVFAGSVVRRHFDWTPFMSRQIKRVRNYVATNDIVVAIFPKGLQWLSYFNLGSAGHDGFSIEHKNLENVRYVPGGHGAAVGDDIWDEIATYVLGGSGPPAIYAPQRTLSARILGSLSALLVLALAGFIGWVGYSLTRMMIDRLDFDDGNAVLGFVNSPAFPLMGLVAFIGLIYWMGKKF